MTITLDTPTTLTTPTVTLHAANTRAEVVFLQAETYSLTARDIVHALAHHLARYGDTLAVAVVDPLAAIDAVLRFDLAHNPRHLTAWAARRTSTDVALILTRAEQIARDYFGTGFPPIPW